MLNRFTSFVIVVLFAVVSSYSASSQEGKKQEPVKTEQKEKTPLKEFACNDDDFTVRSHNEKEIVDVIKSHMKTYHNMTGDEKEIKQMIKEVVKK
jgi:predicted small metal-binding protein